MEDEWVVGGAPLRLEDSPHRGRIEAARRQAVDRFGGNRHDPAGPEDRRRALHVIAAGAVEPECFLGVVPHRGAA